MNLFRRFRKEEPKLMIPETRIDAPVNKPPMPEKVATPKKQCPLCSMVATQGRSGEKKFKFVDGDTATVEIVNQTGVDGRLCYSLFVQNEPEIGFTEMPIRYCPLCSRSLRRPKKQC